MERDDRACRACVGIGVEDNRGLARFRVASQHLAGDEVVHVDVGLVEPQPREARGGNPLFAQMRDDQVCYHRHDFLEDLAALLDEELVGARGPFRCGAVQEAEIIADVVRELGQQAGADDFPCRR